MFRDLWIDHVDAEHLEPSERPFLVGLDQPRIASDIGGEDRRQPTFDASWPCRLHGSAKFLVKKISVATRHCQYLCPLH
jgi:hypothetical protein